MRLIGVDAAKKAVHEEFDECLVWDESGKHTANVIEEILEALPTVEAEPHWIPCSERLPKAGEYEGDVEKYYLVQNEYGDMLVARYTHSKYWEQIYQLKPYADEIVAWMPLPEPYHEGE